MKFAKLASLFGFIALAVLSLSLTSAQVLTLTPNSINQNAIPGQNLVINYNATYVSPSSNSSTLAFVNSVSQGTITTPPQTTINNGSTLVFSSTINIPQTFTGTISGSINATVSGSSVQTIPITITVTQPSSNINIAVVGTQPFSINENATLTLTNTGSNSLAVTMSQTGTLSGLTFNPASLTLNPNSPVDVKAILKTLSNLKFGVNQVNVQATSGSQVSLANFNVKKTFCSAGETLNSNLTIDGLSWDNNGEGEENDWELLDEIEVEMDIRNNNNDDDIDAVAVLGLFDSAGNDVSDELTFLGDSRQDEEQIEININDDDEETVRWEFKVPADFDAGDYKLAVKVYNEDVGQNKDCRDTASELDENFYQPIKIEQTSDEGRFVIVDEIDLDTQLTCGQTTTGQFTVFNVGENDEERVRITIRNRDLNINIVREITSDLDQGEDETLDFSFQVPATASSGSYILEFFTEYDYDNGVYDQEADESTDYAIEVIGCTQNTGNNNGGLTNIRIDAELASEAKAGNELVVIATISNTGTTDATYSLGARGYSSWAELTDISPGTISLDAGESKEVTFTLMVNDDSTGTQSFDMQVSEGGKVQIQEIEVELSSSSGLSGLFASGSSLIWIIGAVNLILIILIIVVAIRMARR